MKCNRCGADLTLDHKFCEECGAPQPSLAPAFAKAERGFAALRARLQAGELDDAAYEAELRQLMVTDDAGDRWMLNADSGGWYRLEGQRWVERDPPLAGQQKKPVLVQPAARPQAPAAQPAPVGEKRSPWKWLALGLGGLLILVIVAGGGHACRGVRRHSIPLVHPPL